MLVLPGSAMAQTLADRVARAGEGQVRMTFAARAGVCGNGRNTFTISNTRDWESACEPGPVRVALQMAGGRVSSVDTYIGGWWRERESGVTDLGVVPAREAAEFLLGLRIKGAIAAATFADSAAVWPMLAAIARDETVERNARREAIFWLGQTAQDAALADLTALIEHDATEREIQEQAVFALSQLRGREGVPALINIARNHQDIEVRKKAMFWLAQSGDPRAIALFEEVLARR